MKFVHRHGMGHLDPGLERRRPRRRSLGLNVETGNGWGDAINGGLPHENEGLQSMTILWGTPNSWKIGPFWYWKLWFWGNSFYPSLRHIHKRILVWRSGTTTLLVLVVTMPCCGSPSLAQFVGQTSCKWPVTSRWWSAQGWRMTENCLRTTSYNYVGWWVSRLAKSLLHVLALLVLIVNPFSRFNRWGRRRQRARKRPWLQVLSSDELYILSWQEIREMRKKEVVSEASSDLVLRFI